MFENSLNFFYKNIFLYSFSVIIPCNTSFESPCEGSKYDEYFYIWKVFDSFLTLCFYLYAAPISLYRF